MYLPSQGFPSKHIQHEWPVALVNTQLVKILRLVCAKVFNVL